MGASAWSSTSTMMPTPSGNSCSATSRPGCGRHPCLPGIPFDLDVGYVSGGGIYVWRDPKVEPFLGAGIGIAHLSPQDSRYDSETRALFSLAGGYRFRLTDNIAMRLEARGYYTLLNTNAAVFCGNGGCIARVDSSGLTQVEINAGLSMRF
jgi:opacity protein-like surface antigen